VFTLGEDGIGGATGLQVEGVPPHWETVFAVDACDETAAAVTAAGGAVMMDPFDIPIGRIAVCADPQGAAFQIIQMAQPADA
jgi:predicted enzyme related to lactoylglutathione lyase